MHSIKHYFKLAFVIILGCGSGVLYAQNPQTIDACINTGRGAFIEQNYAKAETIFEYCLKMDPKNEEVALSLAGIYMTQDKLEAAEKYFNNALAVMPRTSPYWSYTYSMLGDIAYKRNQPLKALEMYNKSLEYNAANVNSLVGRGLVLEYDGDVNKAAESYQSASAVEPLNFIARNRLISLEPEYMTDDQILLALKQRYAVAPEVTELTDEQRELFTKIHQAEQRRGVDYLKNRRVRSNEEQVVTINKNTSFARDMLTLSGYNTLEKSVAQDAVNTFQQVGVPLQDVFELRDLTGVKIFTKESTLTENGFFAYISALKGQKLYLLPKEEIPPTSAVRKKIKQTIANLKKNDYIEITASELKNIETETRCSRRTLQTKLGLVIVPMTKKTGRYFVFAGKEDNSLKTGAYYYTMLNRAKKNPRVRIPQNDRIENYRAWSPSLCADNGTLVFE